MQSKIIADMAKGSSPLRIKVNDNIVLNHEYVCNNSTREYSINRDGRTIGHVTWLLTETELKITSIKINNAEEQFVANLVDETGEGVGTAIFWKFLQLSTALRRQNFVIWNTCNYALLHSARKLSREVKYALNEDGIRDNNMNWQQLLPKINQLTCQFLFAGKPRKETFYRDGNYFNPLRRGNKDCRIEFTEDDRLKIYCGDSLISKARISITDNRFDIIIPLGSAAAVRTEVR